jgi:hypothetical protein
LCRWPQIAPPIIGWIAVDVVNPIRGPRAGHVEKCKAVRGMHSPVNHDFEVALRVERSGNLAGTYSVPSNSSSEHARLSIVMQHFLQSLLRKHLLYLGVQ